VGGFVAEYLGAEATYERVVVRRAVRVRVRERVPVALGCGVRRERRDVDLRDGVRRGGVRVDHRSEPPPTIIARIRGGGAIFGRPPGSRGGILKPGGGFRRMM